MKVTTIPVGMLGTNCYILESGDSGCAVIDPGAQGDKIVSHINAAGLTVRYVLLTHGHHDHIGGVRKVMAAFPEATLHIGAGDIEMLGDGQKSLAIFRNDDDSAFIIGNAKIVGEGDSVEMDSLNIRVLETPGHTRGGVCWICGDVIFSGDTLFCEDVGRTDLYGGDYPTLIRSLKKLAALTGDYTVYPGHGPSTMLDHERRFNMYMNQDVPK